ncbi:hypothetical protein DSO57_1010602 [Entomophthora muscae]|uniref:Uncharacterized protein n=1 Tax=Entomophthora muscae TaxID=34485 RepID=A0ACC2USA0_9FUNG|nr:hypothetical protein DSO57_1010602 [Entomophthora muscae]
MFSAFFSFLAALYILANIQAHPFDGAQASNSLFELKKAFLHVFQLQQHTNPARYKDKQLPDAQGSPTAYPIAISRTKAIKPAIISPLINPAALQKIKSIDHSLALSLIYGGDHIITSSSQTTSHPSNPEAFASHNVPKLETERKRDSETYACGTKYKRSLSETDQCL